MAEYIVEYPDDLVAEGYVDGCINVHDRIVRCRDCKHYRFDPFLHYNDSITTSNCWYFQDYEGTPAAVEPDGFCKWAEPREVE